MATLYPSYLSPDIKYGGERTIFNIFKESKNTDDWVVLHSLNLPEHKNQVYGEIDFLVLAPGIGIICLEVKSGDISRRLGVWKSSNRTGRVISGTKSPIVQIKDNMYSLKERIVKKFGENSRESKLFYCYGVMFPDYPFKSEDCDEEFELPLIYDLSSRQNPIRNYIMRIEIYAENKIHKHYPNLTITYPNEEDIKKLIKFLRGDFEKFVTLKDKLEDAEIKINSFTEKQYKCLDSIGKNPRLIIQGTAGTGKTVIAIESAKRSISNSKTVLFVCFNRLLGYSLGKKIESFKKGYKDNYSFAGPFLEYLEMILPDSHKLKQSQKDIHEYYNKALPIAALDFIKKSKFIKFDKLIIDEAQDLAITYYLEIFDLILKGGLSKGNWEFYYDFEKQNIFNKKSTEDKLQKNLNEKTNNSLTQYVLEENCRNSSLVDSEIGKLFNYSGKVVINAELGDGKAEWKYYKSKEDGVQILEDTLNESINKEKISPSKITILSYHRFKDSLASLINSEKYPLDDLRENPRKFFDSNNLTFGNVYKFKGMENSCIILADIDDEINLKKDENLLGKILYVGMSRAKFSLIILVKENMKNKIEELRKKNFL